MACPLVQYAECSPITVRINIYKACSLHSERRSHISEQSAAMRIGLNSCECAIDDLHGMVRVVGLGIAPFGLEGLGCANVSKRSPQYVHALAIRTLQHG